MRDLPKFTPPTIEEFTEAAQRKGWWAHMVYDDPAYPFRVNLHTHNLWEKFGHLDFQFCIRIPPNLFAMLMDNLTHQVIEHGRVYTPGQMLDDVLEGYNVELIAAREGGRDVLRVCMPDKEGRFRDGLFAEQYTMTYTEEAN